MFLCELSNDYRESMLVNPCRQITIELADVCSRLYNIHCDESVCLPVAVIFAAHAPHWSGSMPSWSNGFAGD